MNTGCPKEWNHIWNELVSQNFAELFKLKYTTDFSISVRKWKTFEFDFQTLILKPLLECIIELNILLAFFGMWNLFENLDYEAVIWGNYS